MYLVIDEPGFVRSVYSTEAKRRNMGSVQSCMSTTLEKAVLTRFVNTPVVVGTSGIPYLLGIGE
jgi:hypothetical protein